MLKKTVFFSLLLSSCSLFPTVFEWGNSNSSGSTTDPSNNEWDGTNVGWFLDQDLLVFDSETLPISLDGATTTLQKGIFQPTADDKLVIKNTVRIKGDIEVRFTGSQPATTHEFLEIDIGEKGDTDPVTIAAFNDADTTTADASQLVFNVAQGKTIFVNMYTDLNFHSVDARDEYDPDGGTNTGAPLPLHVSFRGQGSVIFRMPSGKRLYFGPPNPGRIAEGDDPADDPLSTRGVHVHVLMQQSSLDLYGGTTNEGTPIAPRSQVVFEKWSYAEETGDDAVNTATVLDTWITFGQLSSFVFVSDNYQGISEKWLDAVSVDNDIDLGEPITRPGYGSIAFDPSSAGTGRMILELARGQRPSGNDFTDAGFNVFGVFVAPTMAGTDRQASTILNEDLRNTVYYNQRAGIRAVMRVLDDVSFYERTAQEGAMTAEQWAARVAKGLSTEEMTAEQWTLRPETDRRGLVIINHNNSIPHFSNNYDGATSIDTSRWAQHNNYEPGFILGVNGQISVRPHCFLDYYANNVNKAISSAHGPVGSTHTDAVVKKHNPAAFYTDTLPTYTKRTRYQQDQYGVPISDLLYIGHSAEFGMHASLVLEGNAAAYFRAIAPFTAGAITKALFVQPKHAGHYHLQADGNGDAITVPLGIGQYDGVQVPILDSGNAFVMQSTEPEGAHALDIEGAFSVTSIVGPLGEAATGVCNIAPIELNHAGQEIGYTNFDLWTTWQQWLIDVPSKEETNVLLPDGSIAIFDEDTNVVLTQAAVSQRPLPLGQWFTTHNVSSVLTNAQLTLNGVTWRHNDVLRDQSVPSILPSPASTARPHLVGGELGGLQGKLDVPPIVLNNSTIACHESLVMSGTALSVTDQLPVAADQPETANNTSKIICYNRGREYDLNGYGRVIQLGSKGNVTADGSTTTSLLRSGYIDVYRAGPTTGATAESPTIMRLQLTSAEEPTVTANEDGLHTLFLANESQVRLGWPTVEADYGYTPLSLDEAVLAQLQAADPENTKGFRFNPYETGLGELQIAGGPYVIGAADSLEHAPPDRPVPGEDVGGVVYVNHGGKLSITGTYDALIDTVVARRVAKEAAAMGQLSLPRDQVYYLANGAVQNYAIDFTRHKADSGEHADHVLVDVDEPVHLFNVQQSYPDEDDDDFEPVK